MLFFESQKGEQERGEMETSKKELKTNLSNPRLGTHSMKVLI